MIGRFGRIDVLVNNAGVGAGGAAEESSIEQAQRVFDVNFFGVVRMTKAVLPHMRAQAGGRIINISSVLGFVPVPFGALYAASKHAIEGYSESVDHEVRQHGVRVLLVEPGFTKTAFDASIVPPGTTLAVYANERRLAEEVVAESLASGDAPSVVAAAIVRAATDAKPKLRYPAGRQARQLRTLRRIVPARAFDKQIHKFNRLPRVSFADDTAVTRIGTRVVHRRAARAVVLARRDPRRLHRRHRRQRHDRGSRRSRHGRFAASPRSSPPSLAQDRSTSR